MVNPLAIVYPEFFHWHTIIFNSENSQERKRFLRFIMITSLIFRKSLEIPRTIFNVIIRVHGLSSLFNAKIPVDSIIFTVYWKLTNYMGRFEGIAEYVIYTKGLCHYLISSWVREIVLEACRTCTVIYTWDVKIFDTQMIYKIYLLRYQYKYV